MAAVGWQAPVAAVIGIVIGVPLGIIIGRWLWGLLAREIHAVPLPTVPAGQIGLVVVGTFLLANLVAVNPAQMAARTTTAIVLRSE